VPPSVRTSTHDVFPPYRTVPGPGVGTEPRVPQNRIRIGPVCPYAAGKTLGVEQALVLLAGVEPTNHGRDASMVPGIRGKVELGEDRTDVGLERLRGAVDLVGDRSVRSPLCHSEHLSLAVGQRAITSSSWPPRTSCSVTGVDDHAAFCDGPARADELVEVAHPFLQQVPDCG
jgi:hypothetical protein